MKVYTEGRLPVKCWAAEPESGALEQAINLANHPAALHHIALMPDTHQGYGMPIGGVLFTDRAVVPNAVGVDIGCGMALIETDLSVEEFGPDAVADLLGALARRIPVGFERHEKPPFTEDEMYERLGLNVQAALKDLPIPEMARWLREAVPQVGTLGGGNHFIEVQRDEGGGIYIMLHSGSRHLGKAICDHYNKVAEDLCQRWHAPVPKDLAFLPVEDPEGRGYMASMNVALRWAELNRRTMLRVVTDWLDEMYPGREYDDSLDVHHNYAAWEQHFGKNGIVHRKGAVKAEAGTIVVIPGSMGTASYIARGNGNLDSFMTCQHGAGRAMSRAAARKGYSQRQHADEMTAKGIAMAGAADQAVDERPGAYKDVDEVMAQSADLVTPLARLTPLGVFKG